MRAYCIKSFGKYKILKRVYRKSDDYRADFRNWTSLFGGFGSVVGPIVGALMIGLSINGLIPMDLNSGNN